MVHFSLVAAASLLSGVLAAPGKSSLEARQGYYFQNWSENGSNIQCSDTGGGSYTATWDSAGGFVCGKGWNGGRDSITYSGTYNATGPGYLAVYGWTRNPLIEYYIVESHADLAPNEVWTSKGTFTADDGTYEVFESTRVNKPSIDGDTTFQQYWSVRSEARVGGTVTNSAHFDQWASLGMPLGNHVYVVIATEGYTADGGTGSAGSSSITLE